MLEKFESILKKISPGFECLTYVDTGPVMDKAWAVRVQVSAGWENIQTLSQKKWEAGYFIANSINNYEFDYNFPLPISAELHCLHRCLSNQSNRK